VIGVMIAPIISLCERNWGESIIERVAGKIKIGTQKVISSAMR